MKSVVYVTGNPGKAKYFSELIGLDVPHMSADITEIQSLDPETVVSAKAKQAYAELKRPVLIEDTWLEISKMERLPGPFIKWFIEELGLEGVCRLADSDDMRRGAAGCAYAYYDGVKIQVFHGRSEGTIALSPRGEAGFGWNPVFIPEGHEKTLGEMDDKTFKTEYLKIKPIEAVREFLDKD